MHRIAAALLLACTTLVTTAAPPVPPWAVADDTALAYGQAIGGAPTDADRDRDAFFRGRSLFRRAWIAGPTQDRDGAGLGPLYNRLSCVACHPANGRGRAPQAPEERLQSMLVRLSLPGPGPHGGPRPSPAYGDQLNEEGIPGVPGEGRASIEWAPTEARLDDGTVVPLRRPVLRLVEGAYGPFDGLLTSARVGMGVYGLGLLEAVPARAIEQAARRRQPDGVKGRVNRVWDPVAHRMAIGRFGWKANTATLQAQVVQAAHGDLGLTSEGLPGVPCAPRQDACRAAAGTAIELQRRAAEDLTHYLRLLAPPAPRRVGEPAIERGRVLFARSGCTACHQPTLPTAALRWAGLGPQRIAAYTDLLLHDMGPGLADGRPDFRASGRQWRTAPLWGLGLVPVVNEHSEYLHDGRARSLEEAVLWHGGEAAPAARRYRALPAAERQALLDFLASL